MNSDLSRSLIAHLTGFLLTVIVLPLLFSIGAGAFATVLYWLNYEGMREQGGLAELWRQVFSVSTWLTFLNRLYPWGVACWLAGGTLTGLVFSSHHMTERRAQMTRWALGLSTGLTLGITQTETTYSFWAVPAGILLYMAITLPAFFIAVGLSRRMPRFYEWLSETQVESLFRRR